MHEKGYTVKTVIEGAAVKLIPELAKADHQLHTLWEKTKSAGLIHGVRRACSSKMGTLSAAQEQGLAILGDMVGHPSMARYINEGYEIITF